MIAVLSRFRVANGMEDAVAQAFRDRPRAVEQASGFLWLEVFADADDPTVFYLFTRWTDRPSYEVWHRSEAHRESHALIPKGLKLDAEWTKVFTLDRLDGTTAAPLTEALADAVLLTGDYAAGSANLHVVLLDSSAGIRACNAAMRDQLSPAGGLEGTSLLELMPQADAARLAARLAEPGRRSTPMLLNFAAQNCVPFSLHCWVDVQPSGATLIGEPPLRLDQRMQDQLMAINQDLAVLTRERAREVRSERLGREAAEQLNQDRNNFLTVLAHELKQPIGGALAAMGVLRKLNPDPQLERPRMVLERQLNQIRRLVEDLADTARVAAGNVELRRERVDLSRQLRELAHVWEALAQEQHKSLAAALPDRPVVVSGDVDRLQQVFSNLVGNALKYTPPGGGVTVALEMSDNSALVSVRDEGEGIAPDQLPKIFDLFQRATTTGSGLGVGLAVVRALVEAHGGSVTARSDGIGRGATFSVVLPLASPQS